jgi:signal peptidase II
VDRPIETSDLHTGLSPRVAAFVAGGAVVIVDQLTKWWAATVLPGDPISLIGDFLQLRYVTNSGAAFSMLQGSGSIIALVAIAVVLFIVIVVRQVPHRPEAVALGLVLGGALGNLIDRVFRGDGLLDGEVVDFVDFSFFPAFNAADSAITIGAGLALILAFLRE